MNRPDLTAHAVICDVIADAFDIPKSSASADAETVIVCLRDHGWEITPRTARPEPGAPALRDDARSLGNLVEFLGEKKGELEAMCANPGRLWETVEAAARLVIALAPEPTPEPIQGGVATDKTHGNGWIGVDFDATLSHYEGWKGHEFDKMGPPIPAMMARVRRWLSEGRTVKIFTARAGIPEQIPAVRQWLEAHGLGGLEITNVKDRFMHQLWDDRAIQVEPNTGRRVDGGCDLCAGTQEVNTLFPATDGAERFAKCPECAPESPRA